MQPGGSFAGWFIRHFMEVNHFREACIQVFQKRTRMARGHAAVFDAVQAMRDGQVAFGARDSDVKETAFLVEATFEL